MKSIIKYLLIFVIGGTLLTTCNWPESNFDSLTNGFDANNHTYYVQFTLSGGTWQTSIDENGEPTNIVVSLGVVLLGAPQSSDITVTLSRDATSTMTADEYTLSSNTITIPAGETSGGGVTLTALASEMPEDQTVNLILNMDAGGAEATTGSVIDYNFKRIKFCPLTDYSDLAGTWAGSDNSGYATHVVTSVENGELMIEGMGFEWMQDFWGETIQEMVPVVVTVHPNGTFDIETQYTYTTDWQGSPYRYEVSGSGLWDNCKKTLHIEYDIHYEGESSLCESYGYLCGAYEDITLIH